MTNEILRPELAQLRRKYDEHMEEKTLRHMRLRRELEDRLAEEDYRSLKEIVEEAHHLFRTKKAGKMELRTALRQYGSPKFNELWELIPYEKTVAPKLPYTVSGNEITFDRTGWNWDQIDEEFATLTFTIEQDDYEDKYLYWEDSEAHARFNLNNTAEIDGVLNK